MDKILVLGSNSFAGSMFVDESLNQGFIVLGVSRSAQKSALFSFYRSNPNVANFSFKQLHIVNELQVLLDLVSDFDPDYVVDFAGQGMVAESWAAPDLWFTTNVVSKVSLHNHLKDHRALRRYIRVSTPEVYGDCTQAISESTRYNPSSPYAVSHAAIDMSLMTFFKNYGFPVILARFSNFYGPGQQLYRIVPKTVLSALTKTEMMLHGGGETERSFIHGKDVSDGLMKVLKEGVPGEIYHFSTDEFIKIKDLVFEICQRVSVDPATFIRISEDRPGKDFAYRMSSEKARKELGWAPRFYLSAGIDTTVEWVNKNISTFKSLPWNYIHQS